VYTTRTRPYRQCTGHVHGPVDDRGHGPCTEPCMYTTVYTACTRLSTRSVYGPCTRPCSGLADGRVGPFNGRVRAVYTTVYIHTVYMYESCTHVDNRIHGPYTYTVVYTIVYTARTRPCTGRVHGPCQRPCAGRLHMYTGRIHTRPSTGRVRTRPLHVYMARRRP